MSNFLTPIPIHLDKIKALLPPGSTIERLEWNKKTNCVDLFWHNGKLKTKYLWAWPWPLAQLENKQVPEGVEPSEQRKQEMADPLNMRKVLTVPTAQTTTQQSEKLAGKAKEPVQAKTRPENHGAVGVLHKRNAASLPADKRRKTTQRSGPAANSNPAPAPVDGSKPATTGGVSLVNHG